MRGWLDQPPYFAFSGCRRVFPAIACPIGLSIIGRLDGAGSGPLFPRRAQGAIRLFMIGKAEELLAAALDLPESDRASLAGALLRSLDDEASDDVTMDAEVEAAWAGELRRRVDDIQSGRVATSPW